MERYCVFCNIVAGKEPATVVYEDDAVMVFENILGWTRVMLLAVPREHRTQTELWENLGSVGRIAVEMGRRHAPEGFRLLSNFGALGMQSQSHGHMHILNGTEPDVEVRGGAARSIVDAVRESQEEVLRTDHAVFFNAYPLFRVYPLTVLCLRPEGEPTQEEFWSDLGALGADVAHVGWASSQQGFRLLSNFPGPQRLPGGEKGHLHLLGGTFLGHYA